MSDDMLKDAIRSLRDEAPGKSDAASATRMRVLGTVRAEQRRRVLAVRASVALLAAAVGGTAWAAATGRLPPPSALVQLFVDESSTDSVPAPPPGRRGTAGSGAPAAPTPDAESTHAEPGNTPPPPAAEPPSVADAPPSEGPGPAPAPSAAGPNGNEPVTSPRTGATAGPGSQTTSSRPAPAATAAASAAPKASASAASSASPSAAPDNPVRPSGPDAAADALYQRAHALHFQTNDYAAARAAWLAYLAAAPGGRFAPFAHYNHALCLVRLGRTAEAKRALQPFASGAFGGYRKAEAQSLIDAMEAKQP